MRTSRLLAWVCLALTICAAAVAQDSMNEDVIDQWAGHGPIAWLIPIQLMKIPYDKWDPALQRRIPKKASEDFRERVADRARKIRAGRERVDCGISIIQCFSGASDEPVSLLMSAEFSHDVVIGKVETIVPVWDQLSQKVSSLVYLRVEQTLKGTIPLGALIKYWRPNGLVKIGFVTLCSRYTDDEGLSRAIYVDDVAWLTKQQEHETYLVMGKLSKFHACFLDTFPPHEYRVENGQAFKAGEPTRLEELRDRMAVSSAPPMP
jgi:hypothetical protein